MREFIPYRAAQFVLRSLAHAPLPIANRLGRFYATLLDRLIPRLRRVGMRNLAMAFPQLSHAHRKLLIDGVFRSIGRLLVALARFPQINRENVSQWIRYEGYEHFQAALDRGKGVLFATAHLGNWELSAFAHALLSAPMHVVVRPLDNPLIDAMVEHRRALSGNHLIGKRDFSRSILKALHRNEAVGILVDQNSSLDNGVFVDFFGTPACTSLSFARIAAHSGAVVIPGFAVWSEAESRYILRFYPAVEITGDAEEDTRRIQKQIEAAIAEYPDQWLWIHRRWKTRPPGDPPLYD
ncbi:MAG: lysophospholipid acyltransferase family protein [Acidobacteriota bacterium]|nr:lysophospholipid acyltransferase family protein [Acidobacteriota bacterium]